MFYKTYCLLINLVLTDDHPSQSSNGFGNRGNINTVAKCKTLPPSQGITITPIKYTSFPVFSFQFSLICKYVAWELDVKIRNTVMYYFALVDNNGKLCLNFKIFNP